MCVDLTVAFSALVHCWPWTSPLLLLWPVTLTMHLQSNWTVAFSALVCCWPLPLLLLLPVMHFQSDETPVAFLALVRYQ